MTELDMKINTRLMEEIGLEEGDRRRVIDQDTGILYQMKGKDIVSPGSQSGKAAIEFDPINNTRMMSYMFGSFVEKLVDEEDIPPVNTYFIKATDDNSGKVTANIIFDDNSRISSGAYKNETTCYADLIMRLNGEDDVDLSEFDIDRSRKTDVSPMKFKKEPKKRGRPPKKKEEST